jgi:cysteine desulfuration protein SufE
MQPLSQRIEQLLIELRAIEDRDLRFELLIELAQKFKEVPASMVSRPFSAQNKVPACESDAFAFAYKDSDNNVHFEYAVENPQGISAKALAVILKENLSGYSAEEISKVDEQMVNDIFGKTISMGKGQGLMGMIRLSKNLASTLCKELVII